MYSSELLVDALGISKPRLNNYIHRGHAVHCGKTPVAGQARDIPLLGAYEIGWIAALVRNGVTPPVASAHFQSLLEKASYALHDRNFYSPIYVYLSRDLSPPFFKATRGWVIPWRKEPLTSAQVVMTIDTAALFGGVDAALNRAISSRGTKGNAYV